MPPKIKKPNVIWNICENCAVNIISKDVEIHSGHCPPDLKKWKHPFVREGNFFSTLAIKSNDDYNGLSIKHVNEYVFLSQNVMQVCGFVIGNYVLLQIKDKNLWLVKRAWPCFEKSLTSVLLNEKVYERLNLNSKETNVIVSKIVKPPETLRAIHLQFLNKPEDDIFENLKIFLEGHYSDKILQPIDKHFVDFLGKIYKFNILKVETYEEDKSLEKKLAQLDIQDDKVPALYQVVPSTKWVYINDAEMSKINLYPISKIGGLSDVITELRDILMFALGLQEPISNVKLNTMRGILLYGPTGCGKTLLAKSIAHDLGAQLFEINGPEIFSKFFGATESTLRTHFKEAKLKCPSVILLDEVDVLCPSKPGTEQERRVTSALSQCLDDLTRGDKVCQTAVIATTNRPENLHASIRRAGRLDNEIEVPVPNNKGRLDILQKLLCEVPNTCSSEILLKVANSAHGCTGADLGGMCSLAASQAVKRVVVLENIPQGITENVGDFKHISISDEDLLFAATNTKPSAMREIAIEIPDVKWTDIGGQHDLKLKLKQAVEWPLTNPDSFIRLGIKPPKGVLMYGPPGCSKTMIAKALANESGLNFLSVKGPELFSQYVGESERAVRELFRKARRVAPSVVFFDEIDALGTVRSNNQGSSGSNVQERVLAQLLTELDGVAPLENVTVLAATNRPDRLDRALLRPGRLDRIVYVPLPDLQTRHEIFKVTISRMPVSDNIYVDKLALLTEGYSGAEIKAVCHEAAMLALEEHIDAEQINLRHFEMALIRVKPRTPKDLLNLYENYANET